MMNDGIIAYRRKRIKIFFTINILFLIQMHKNNCIHRARTPPSEYYENLCIFVSYFTKFKPFLFF